MVGLNMMEVLWIDARHPHWTNYVWFDRDGQVRMLGKMTDQLIWSDSDWHSGWTFNQATKELVVTIHCLATVQKKTVRFKVDMVNGGLTPHGVVFSSNYPVRMEFLNYVNQDGDRIHAWDTIGT